MEVLSWASSEAVRKSMLGNKGRDTKPELAIRRLIHASGLRYRTSFRPIRELRRTADIVFTRRKIAVFVDGCFWHACPEHYKEPRANADYWSPKIERNRQRDLDTTRQLEDAGWIVLRYWSHENPADVALDVVSRVRAQHSINEPAATPVTPSAQTSTR